MPAETAWSAGRARSRAVAGPPATRTICACSAAVLEPRMGPRRTARRASRPARSPTWRSARRGGHVHQDVAGLRPAEDPVRPLQHRVERPLVRDAGEDQVAAVALSRGVSPAFRPSRRCGRRGRGPIPDRQVVASPAEVVRHRGRPSSRGRGSRSGIGMRIFLARPVPGSCQRARSAVRSKPAWKTAKKAAGAPVRSRGALSRRRGCRRSESQGWNDRTSSYWARG